MPTPYESHASYRISITGKCFLLVTAQLILLYYMAVEATSDAAMIETLVMPPEKISTVIARFVCAFIMHVTLTGESKQGLSMMKYASNHPWKFRSWRHAYLIGFFQAFVLVTCEAVNLIILTTNDSMLDIIMNFLAIVVITEFDDSFFFIVKGEKLAELLSAGEMVHKPKGSEEEKTILAENIFKIEVTTSDSARMKLSVNRLRQTPRAEDSLLDPTTVEQPEQPKPIEGEPEYIFI